jgi:hypothetical protein
VVKVELKYDWMDEALAFVYDRLNEEPQNLAWVKAVRRVAEASVKARSNIPFDGDYEAGWLDSVLVLATIWKDHPAYDSGWAP